MPRTFWYHVAITCILSLGTAALGVHRAPHEAGTLCLMFAAPDRSISLPAVPCLFVLLGVAAFLGARISGSVRPASFIVLYVLALFTPFIFLATRFWIDLLALLLLALSMRLFLEPYTGMKSLATALLPLFAAILVRGQLALAAPAVPLYLLAARRWRAALCCTLLFALPYAALLSLDVGAIGRIRTIIPAPTAAGSYAFERILSLFRACKEFQLIMGFIPFVLAAAIGLGIHELKHDRNALFLNLLLCVWSLLLFPASLGDPDTARLVYLMLGLFTILSANSGMLMMQEAAQGPRALQWSVVLAGLFLLPALISVVWL